MQTILSILLIIAGLIALALVAGLFMKNEHFVQREIVINAPVQKVYDFLKLLKNQSRFNNWAKEDLERNWQYTGTDGTVGFIISWNGNRKVGEGAKEITKLIEGQRVETQIRFVRPMKTTANVVMQTEAISDTQTKVIMSNAGTLKYPINIMIPIAEKMFPKDMDESLVTLKSILEK